MLKCLNFEILWWWCIQVDILCHQVQQVWWIQWDIIITSNKNHQQLRVELRKFEENIDKWWNFEISNVLLSLFFCLFLFSSWPVFVLLLLLLLLQLLLDFSLSFDVVICAHLWLFFFFLFIYSFVSRYSPIRNWRKIERDNKSHRLTGSFCCM